MPDELPTNKITIEIFDKNKKIIKNIIIEPHGTCILNPESIVNDLLLDEEYHRGYIDGFNSGKIDGQFEKI